MNVRWGSRKRENWDLDTKGPDSTNNEHAKVWASNSKNRQDPGIDVRHDRSPWNASMDIGGISRAAHTQCPSPMSVRTACMEMRNDRVG